MAYVPQFTITPTLLTEVEQVAALRERIQSAVVDLAWIPALQKDTRTRNVHASTAIEGNPLTLEQVRALEEGRELSASGARPKQEVHDHFSDKQEQFLDFVLMHYVKEGVEELELERLTKLLRLRYHDSIPDAVADLGGDIAEIRNLFSGFQRYLYQGALPLQVDS